MSKLSLAIVSGVCAAVALGAAAGASDAFPYRSQYPDVPFVDTEALAAKYAQDEVIIVDVRSNIEYEVIHAVGAVHLPLSSESFLEDLGKLRADYPQMAFAFYCNGVTCLKSYEAAQSALVAGFDNCYAYDAGIPGWANAYPDQTILLGKPIVDPGKQLIPKSMFAEKCVDFEQFAQIAGERGVIVVDVRDAIQRSGSLPGLENAVLMPMDQFIREFVLQKQHQDKMVLIFDQVGKQVRWLEYYLVDQGYEHYAFLKGGATDVLGRQAYR